MKSEHIEDYIERNFYRMTDDLTDRELLEKQTYYLQTIKKDNHRTMNNVLFIFWFLIASVAASIFFWIKALNSVPQEIIY